VSAITAHHSAGIAAWKGEDNMSAVPVPVVPALQLKRILYTTDFSEASRLALPIVSAISRKYGSQVYAVNVCSQLSGRMSTIEATPIREQQEQDAKAEMARLVETSGLEQSQTRPLVRTGGAAEEISQIAAEQRVNLAILSTHGRTGFKRLLMGSVAEALLHSLSCPILTAGPHLGSRFQHWSEIKTVLCPTDLSPESRAVFPCVSSLAAEYRAKIVALHVVPPQSEGGPDEKGRERLRAEMKELFFPQIDPRCQLELVIAEGDRVTKILESAKALDADLISFGVREGGKVMLTHFRETVTYKIVLEAECPVLTFRGFAAEEAKQAGEL
jgi:nucleotide-binding universal stress UspA family protein